MSVLSSLYDPTPAKPLIGKDVRDTMNDHLTRTRNLENILGVNPEPQVYSDARALVDATGGEIHLPYTGGFDFYRDAPNKPYSIQATQDLNTWRFECRNGDGNLADPNGTDRSELVGNFSLVKKNNNIPFGRKICQSFSQRFSGQLSTNPAHFAVVNQWHAAQESTEDSLSPPLAFNFAGDSFRISKLWDDQVKQVQGTTDTHFQGIYYDTGNKIPFDQWIDWYLEIVFDYTNPGKGSIFIMRDQKVVVDLKDTSVGFNDPQGPRLQYGLYRSKGYPGTMSVEYTNMELSYAPLFDRAYNPRPIPIFA